MWLRSETSIIYRTIKGNHSQLISLGMVKDVKWVSTDKMLAYCMTKKGKKADWLMKVSSENILAI